ncbi:MAG: glutaredoxin [endosymbiont of Escarpia spicata]|uniref:Glutaredoxin n=1 Tax=endosymbiont of Escarpia spicata TaxID=2200908 RepID=A0A370DAJ7_9GAMM|nr:MAG: glutaredoxin [endosymbiont of Escarpia spicata]
MLDIIKRFLGAAAPIHRSMDEQQQVDEETRRLALYQFSTCSYCIKVHRVIKQLGLNIEYRDAANNQLWKQALIKEGGLYQTPCLHIEHQDGSVQWMYESADIIRYLKRRFST